MKITTLNLLVFITSKLNIEYISSLHGAIKLQSSRLQRLTGFTRGDTCCRRNETMVASLVYCPILQMYHYLLYMSLFISRAFFRPFKVGEQWFIVAFGC